MVVSSMLSIVLSLLVVLVPLKCYSYMVDRREGVFLIEKEMLRRIARTCDLRRALREARRPWFLIVGELHEYIIAVSHV